MNAECADKKIYPRTSALVSVLFELLVGGLFASHFITLLRISDLLANLPAQHG